MRANHPAGFCLFLFFALVPIASAQAPPTSSTPPSSTTSSPADESNAKEPYVYELIERTVRFEADGRGHNELTIRVRIQSESVLRELGVLVYSYASSFESLDVLYVRVRKPDGTVVETPATDIQDLDSAVSREAPMYTDEREKHIAVKSLSVGDILEYQLRWTIHDPIAPGHFWFDYSYFTAGISLQEILRIDVPANVPVKLHNSDPQPSVSEADGRRVYTFKSSHLKKQEESKIPDWEKNFHGAPPPDVQISSFSSWEEIGKWFYSLEQPKVTVTPEIRAKAEELTKGKTSDDEKIHAIYDFVSTRFRYIGIDLGVGRYTPHSASDVLANRYGDCKDKHTLFASLLQAVGISAYPALVSSKFRVDPSFPTSSLFDHVITAIPHGDSFLFLDTTPEVAPYGLLLATIRGRQVLVSPNDSPAHLVMTPLDPPFPNREHYTFEASIDTNGVLDAKVRLEDRGDTELTLRSAYRSVPQNRWQELTQNVVARMGFGGTVSDVSVLQPEDTSQPFWITYSYHRPDYPDWKNHRVTLLAPPLFIPQLNDAQKLSKDPLPLGALQDVTYESTMKFPEGFTPISLEKVQEKNDFADYSVNYSVEKGVLRGTVHFRTLLHEIPAEDRSKFDSLAKKAEDTWSRYVFVSGNFPVSDSSNLMVLFSTDPKISIPALEKNVADHPGQAYMISLLSRAYCKAHRPKDAVALIQKSLANDIDAPALLDLPLANAYLAIPDIDKAMDQYRKALGDDPMPQTLNDVAYSLAEANVRLEDALTYSSRAVSTVSQKTKDISPESAQPSDFLLMAQLAANWDTLGWIKFHKGDTLGGLKYLEAAWQIGQTDVIGEHLVEVYEKLGKKHQAAVICNMAVAALGATSAGPDPDIRAKISEEMTRLRPFLAASPSSGGHPQDGHAALAEMRSIDVPVHIKLKGQSARANFVISLINGGRVDNVVFLSGSEELRNAIAALSAVKFPYKFPDETPARILLKTALNCNVFSKNCFLFISTVSEASAPSPGTVQFFTKPG